MNKRTQQIVTTEHYDDPEAFEAAVAGTTALSWDVTLRMDNTSQERPHEVVGYIVRVQHDDPLDAVEAVLESGVADHAHLRSLRLVEGLTGSLHVGVEPSPETS